MRKVRIMYLATGIGLACWTAVASAGLFSARGPVIAIVADELFVGSATGHIDGTGTVVIQSQRNPDLKCAGEFASNVVLGGSGRMNCSDGTTATFQFKRLSLRRGYGEGSTSRGAMSFAYGLTAEESKPYLKLPEGKKLAYNGTKLEIAGL